VTYRIRHVAVVGAGTMGAGIAAQAANAGLAVDLLDIAPETLTPEEERKGLALDAPAVRNRIVRAGFERMSQAKPPALMAASVASRIRLGNLADHHDRLREADWIVEAVVENPSIKQKLMEWVEAAMAPSAIVSSNTSGIPLARIAEGRSAGFRRHFLGTHFFNPPRYMKLLEIIPTADTDPALVDFMRAFGERVLGKGVVLAKDTPNFIANRIGSWAGMQKVRYALDHGYGIEEVDAITGPLIGHPKTATFRLADLVGLDVKLDVAGNLYDLVPEDEWRDSLRIPEPLQRMRQAGLLGNKAGGGFYRRARRDGRTVFDVLDLDSLTYRPARPVDIPLIAEAEGRRELGDRLRYILSRAEAGPLEPPSASADQDSTADRSARYIRDTLLPSLAYAAARLLEIADSPLEVDRALEWGYAHEAGPFRIWDLLGVQETARRMQALGLQVAPWVLAMLAAGNSSFYRREDGREMVYSPITERYEVVREDSERIDLGRIRASGGELAHNQSASLLDLGDAVLCLEIHSRNSVRDGLVKEMIHRALHELEESSAGRSEPWLGLVIANQAQNFCVGANLREIGALGEQGDEDAVVKAVKDSQDLLMELRFCACPVVVAAHGMTLGGGAELAMHADRIVAAAETSMGLVETRVGLIPAGGGCKELLRRIVAPAMSIQGTPYLPSLRRAFETIALARVSSSALEAREMGFLRDTDRIIMNRDHALAAAKEEVLAMAPDYRPPARERSVYAAGAGGLAALRTAIRQSEWARFATPYDVVVADQVACVLAGGDLSAPQWVPEEYILRLEREAFAALLQKDGTRERIGSFLERGKPGRS
jgi:3-hydroxyacyl-CoA dehydrogenase